MRLLRLLPDQPQRLRAKAMIASTYACEAVACWICPASENVRTWAARGYADGNSRGCHKKYGNVSAGNQGGLEGRFHSVGAGRPPNRSGISRPLLLLAST
jgi:hypothetical protein